MCLRGTKMNIQDNNGHTNAENDKSLVHCICILYTPAITQLISELKSRVLKLPFLTEK